MSTIAFIGLGNMGAPMARNLLKAGMALRVFDIVPAAREALAAAGATNCASIAEAVAGANIIITMLPAGEHVLAAYGGAAGILAHAAAGALLIDCSTINAEDAKKIAAEARAKNFIMLDAPVSGGTGGAAAGTLTFIVGGDVAGFDAAKPVFEKMGKNIFHAGESGMGQIAKICNNMLLGILMIGTSEALALGAAHGLDMAKLSEIMGKSSGRNWALEVYNPAPGVMENAPASRGYSGGFGTDLMVKDLKLAQAAAAHSAATTPLGALALEVYLQHQQAGNGKLDFSSVFRHISPAK